MKTWPAWTKLALPAYLLAWLSPSLCFLLSDFRLVSVEKVLLTLAFFCVWHLAFASFERAVYYSAFFLLVLLPFDLFFFLVYQEPPGTPVFLSISDSNLIEATDFMRGRATSLLCCTLFAAGIWLMTARAARRGLGQNWRCYQRGTRRAARAVLALLAALMLQFPAAPAAERLLLDSGHAGLAAAVKKADDGLFAPLANVRPIFPLGRFISLGEFCRENTYLRHAEQQRALFRYHARQLHPPAARQIYVLVIGETARADRFVLNGYTRGLPSFLARQENVIPLHDIITPFTYTNLSVPTMLTPPLPQEQGRDRARSLVSAFREAGFKTYWISNQQPIGMRETEVSHFSREADEVVFMNLSIRTMHMDGLYDEHLIEPLAKFLARHEQKQFFVLHMLGSHDSYQRRYPPAFDILQPSLRSQHDPDHHDRRNKLAVENSYDNAMHYTDYVLARIIETVGRQDAVSALVYAADHGETLFDGDCGRSGHGSSGRQEFPVAAMAWVSHQYKAQWPARVERLVKNASAPITTEAILPTMLDLAAIDTTQLDQSRSLASAAFRAQTRWVNAPEPIDWDSATTRGACHLLVAGKPKDKLPALAGSGHGLGNPKAR
ncbi:phosphoethanolamine transferase [Massilia solisilvae]|uniref:Phosphoethanolamine transferase n=1 Tax=Massilia solisilvae TaxID=1811225 RepID=A0ABT2BQ85_9BURK|nr:phosphoethanolamine transferase [Massilia solisilvae]MCS0610675.1 phosphoethanolamine transferase [Massilia solisilvae]